MKKIDNKALISKSTLLGATVGLISAVLIIILSFDAPVIKQTQGGLRDLFFHFPGLWAVVLLPFIFAVLCYHISKKISAIINKQANRLKKEAGRTKMVLSFIENLRQDKLDVPFSNRQKNDPTSKALLRLRDYMIKSKAEQEKRRIEEEQRNWVAHGLAQFGEILRKSNDNLEELSYEITRYLVSYLKVNQGGVYLLNETKNGEKYFELTACIAFDRRKYADKIINWSEGLIGRCGLEKETILLTDVPDNYINITSGLGEANPGTILIVPLKTNDELYGVIELAAFQVLQPFEVELVEKSAESIQP